jgi:hypothetical protein
VGLNEKKAISEADTKPDITSKKAAKRMATTAPHVGEFK